MATILESSAGRAPTYGNVIARVRPVNVPRRLIDVRGLRALPESLSDEPVIYALCTERETAPGRVEGEALYVGLTDDLDRRRSEHRTAFWERGWEPFTLTLWWEHPAAWGDTHGVTAHVAEQAFQQHLLPRYNRPRSEHMSGLHRKALRLHGIRL